MSHTEDELAAFAEWERASWEQRAAAYAASLHRLTRGSIPAMLDAAGIDVGTRVLDVGTGPGFVAQAAMRRTDRVVAVDQSQAMVDLARASGVDARLGGAESLPLPDGACDVVLAGYVLNHLARPELAMQELWRVLAPGGSVVMTVWDLPEANPALGLFGPVVAELGLTTVVPAGPDAQRFSADSELHRLLAAWEQVQITRPTWPVCVEPGQWFDAVAAATPRTGAVLAEAPPEQRATARARYVELARERYPAAGDQVELPARAVMVSARRPTGQRRPDPAVAPVSTVPLTGVSGQVLPDGEACMAGEVLEGVVRLRNDSSQPIEFTTGQHAVGSLLDDDGRVVASWSAGMRASGQHVHLPPGQWQDLPFATGTTRLDGGGPLPAGDYRLRVAVSVSPWLGEGPSGTWVAPDIEVRLVPART